MSISGKSEDQPPPYTREPHYPLKHIEGFVGDRMNRDSDIGSDTSYEDMNRRGYLTSPSGSDSSTRNYRQSNLFEPIDPLINYTGPRTRVSHPSYPDSRAQNYNPNTQQNQPARGGRDNGYSPDYQSDRYHTYEAMPGREYGMPRSQQQYQGSYSEPQFVLYGQDIETGNQACNGERRRHGGRREGGLLQRRRERKDGRDGSGGRLAGRGLVGGLLGRAGDSLGEITRRK